jgi:thymidylate kinase
MIIDGTGANFDKIKKSSEIFKNLGYDSYMIFVNTSLEIALERNNSRERKLSNELVKEKWENVQKNIGKFQNYFGQMNFIVIDNNNINDEVLTKVYKRVLKIINFPIKNVIAKNWIKDQKLKKST